MRRRILTVAGMLFAASMLLFGCGKVKLTPVTTSDDKSEKTVIVVEAAESLEITPELLFMDLDKQEKVNRDEIEITEHVNAVIPGDYPVKAVYDELEYEFIVRVEDTVAPKFLGYSETLVVNSLEAVSSAVTEIADTLYEDVTEVSVTVGAPVLLEPAEPTLYDTYNVPITYEDLGGNVTDGMVSVICDTIAPVFQDAEGNAASFENKTITSEDLTITPDVDHSAYSWVDNYELADSTETIECTDTDNHIWTVTLYAKDSVGNETTITYTITVKEPKKEAPKKKTQSTDTGGSNLDYEVGEGYFNTEYAEEVLRLVNEERAAEGLPALTMNYTLIECSNTRAVEIVNTWSHTRPDGTQCFTAFNVSYRYAGENIACGQMTPEWVVSAWMNSPGHRKNIMSENFTEIAISCYVLPGSYYTYYWSQNFIG